MVPIPGLALDLVFPSPGFRLLWGPLSLLAWEWRCSARIMRTFIGISPEKQLIMTFVLTISFTILVMAMFIAIFYAGCLFVLGRFRF